MIIYVGAGVHLIAHTVMTVAFWGSSEILSRVCKFLPVVAVDKEFLSGLLQQFCLARRCYLVFRSPNNLFLWRSLAIGVCATWLGSIVQILSCLQEVLLITIKNLWRVKRLILSHLLLHDMLHDPCIKCMTSFFLWHMVLFRVVH